MESRDLKNCLGEEAAEGINGRCIEKCRGTTIEPLLEQYIFTVIEPTQPVLFLLSLRYSLWDFGTRADWEYRSM